MKIKSEKLYKGTFNWYGELHVLYTHAKCQNAAFNNFCTQLSKKLDKSRRSIYIYFVDGSKDNYKIKMERR